VESERLADSPRDVGLCDPVVIYQDRRLGDEQHRLVQEVQFSLHRLDVTLDTPEIGRTNQIGGSTSDGVYFRAPGVQARLTFGNHPDP
jgi:hypothetical protein